jgi:hypothetical protein
MGPIYPDRALLVIRDPGRSSLRCGQCSAEAVGIIADALRDDNKDKVTLSAPQKPSPAVMATSQQPSRLARPSSPTAATLSKVREK